MQVPVIVYDLVATDPEGQQSTILTMRTRTAVDNLLADLKKLMDQGIVLSSYITIAVSERATTIEAESVLHAGEKGLGYTLDWSAISTAVAQAQQQE